VPVLVVTVCSVVLHCACARHACPAPAHPCSLCPPPHTPRPAAVEYLATRGYDPAFGARPVKRVVQQELETALAKGILRGDFAVSFCTSGVQGSIWKLQW
jgi:hypothetical protein